MGGFDSAFGGRSTPLLANEVLSTTGEEYLWHCVFASLREEKDVFQLRLCVSA